jgi:glycosyltransferase involved in cell wall biosynthesis
MTDLHTLSDHANQALVSVVTPFHNTADYLEQCIRSVLDQTYGNFEYLLVDNCSTDGSGNIAERYASEDARIRLVRTPRLFSQIDNYNEALAQISPDSRYCKIVQADDYLFPDCLSKMTEVAHLDSRVGLVASYRLDGKTVSSDGCLDVDEQVIDGREICRRLLRGAPFVFGTPTSVLYDAEIVRSRRPFYPENALHEDTEVCYEILKERDFGFVHQVLSFSRVNEESISGKVVDFRPDRLDGLIVVKTYGAEFLAAAEFQQIYGQTLNDYFRFLGRALFSLKGNAFWQYHLDGLERAGIDFGMEKRFKFGLFALAELVLNPWSTIEQLLRHLRRP